MARDMASLAGVGGVYGGPMPMAPTPTTPLFSPTGAQIYSPYKPPAGGQNNKAQVQAYAGVANAAAPKAPTPLSPMPGPPAPTGGDMGPAPVVEPKPSAPPPSMAGLDAAMGPGGGGGEAGVIGSLQPSLRMLGRRTPPQDSMALAGVAGSIY